MRSFTVSRVRMKIERQKVDMGGGTISRAGGDNGEMKLDGVWSDSVSCIKELRLCVH